MFRGLRSDTRRPSSNTMFCSERLDRAIGYLTARDPTSRIGSKSFDLARNIGQVHLLTPTKIG